MSKSNLRTRRRRLWIVAVLARRGGLLQTLRERHRSSLGRIGGSIFAILLGKSTWDTFHRKNSSQNCRFISVEFILATFPSDLFLGVLLQSCYYSLGINPLQSWIS